MTRKDFERLERSLAGVETENDNWSVIAALEAARKAFDALAGIRAELDSEIPEAVTVEEGVMALGLIRGVITRAYRLAGAALPEGWAEGG